MNYSAVDYSITGIGIVVNAITAFMMARKHLFRRFPAVTIRSALNATTDAVAVGSILAGGWHFNEVFYVGWFVGFSAELFAFAEVTRDVFPAFRVSSRLSIAAIVFALALAATTVVPHAALRLSLERALAIFEILLLCFLAVYLFSRGRSWYSYGTAFVLCFGIAATVKIAISVFQELHGWSRSSDELSAALQVLALMGWLGYVVHPAKQPCSGDPQEAVWLAENSAKVSKTVKRITKGAP